MMHATLQEIMDYLLHHLGGQMENKLIDGAREKQASWETTSVETMCMITTNLETKPMCTGHTLPQQTVADKR